MGPRSGRVKLPDVLNTQSRYSTRENLLLRAVGEAAVQECCGSEFSLSAGRLPAHILGRDFKPHSHVEEPLPGPLPGVHDEHSLGGVRQAAVKVASPPLS